VAAAGPAKVAACRIHPPIARRWCARPTRIVFLAALFAPGEHRGALYALYAFNIEITRVRESIREPLAGEIRLQWWNDAIAGKAAGDVEANPVAAALLAAVARYRLPSELLTGLIAGAPLRSLRRSDGEAHRIRRLCERNFVRRHGARGPDSRR